MSPIGPHTRRLEMRRRLPLLRAAIHLPDELAQQIPGRLVPIVHHEEPVAPAGQRMGERGGGFSAIRTPGAFPHIDMSPL
jgi:hypothetical protein